MSEDALASQSDCSIRSPIHISTCVKMLCAGLPKVVKQMITAANVAQTCWDSIIGICHRKVWPTTFTLQQWRCLGHVRHIHARTHDIDDKRCFEIVIVSTVPVNNRDDGCFELHHYVHVCTTRGANPVEQSRG